MSKAAMALSVVAGSFFIYCGQSAMRGPGGSGPVGSANGQSSGGGTCCAPPAEKFTVLAHGDFKDQSPTAAISTAGYRELLVYTTSGGYSCAGGISFRADATSPFFAFHWFAAGSDPQASQRVQVQGSDVQLSGSCGGGSSPILSSPWVIAGVSN